MLIAGCGGGAERPKPTATPAPPDLVRFCTDAGPGWKPLAAGSVDAAVLGKGTPVVLLNESDNDPCAWTSFASSLAGAGHRVAVFRYTSTAAKDEPASADEALAVAKAVLGRADGRGLPGHHRGGARGHRPAAVPRLPLRPAHRRRPPATPVAAGGPLA